MRSAPAISPEVLDLHNIEEKEYFYSHYKIYVTRYVDKDESFFCLDRYCPLVKLKYALGSLAILYQIQ